MSEYQYYEFRALDRPLTQAQMDGLRSLSSRAQITPVSFINEYNYGDFRGSPRELMEEYFDAFLYVANWGLRELTLRLPQRLVDPESLSVYCCGETVSSWSKGDQLILEFRSEEEGVGWEEGEGWLTSLVPLRSDLMNGDHRCLYLGWLLAAEVGELDDEDMEPPVPPGLGELTASLDTFAEFLRIDPDLITAAAERSGAGSPLGLTKEEITGWVAQLPSKEKEEVLIRILEGDDPHIVAEFRQRALSEIHGAGRSADPAGRGDRRTVGELIARSEVIAEERRKAEAEQQARKKARREREEAARRKKHLESLSGKEDSLWTKIDELIAAKQRVPYDEAVSLLQDLRDLAAMKGNEAEFSRRMSELARELSGRAALMKRFRNANLLQ